MIHSHGIITMGLAGTSKVVQWCKALSKFGDWTPELGFVSKHCSIPMGCSCQNVAVHTKLETVCVFAGSKKTWQFVSKRVNGRVFDMKTCHFVSAILSFRVSPS